MTSYPPEMYCQEVWDLGRAVQKFNTWIQNEYFETFNPKLTRILYKYIALFITKIIADEDLWEEEDGRDLFFKLTQTQFNNFVMRIYKIIVQMPNRTLVEQHFENILSRLRDFNVFLDTEMGQNMDWHRIYDQFLNMVDKQLWTSEELLNNVPNDTTNNQHL